MTTVKSADPWGDLAVVEQIRATRTAPPRRTGLTMVIDKGLGLCETADLLEVAGHLVDHWKLSFGTSVFVPPAVLRRKLALINERGILTFPGGTLFEAAIVQQHCRVFMTRARELSFTAVEISDGTIDLSAERRRRVIDCARNAGLVAITEVGKKDPSAQPSPEALAAQALADLDCGAEVVIVEGRESGRGIGVYDRDGDTDLGAVDTLARMLGDRADCLLWEAPLEKQQTTLIGRFGINVNLGNIDPREVLAVEALRAGLRFETLKPLADELARAGAWAPDRVEGNGSGGGQNG